MKIRKIPQRMCVGCQEMKEKRALIRVVRTPEEEYIIDTTGKKSGRGAYICSSLECFNKALKNKGFNKAFKANIPNEILENLKGELNNEA